MNSLKKKAQMPYNWLPILVLIVCSICLFIRSFYSFSWSDESFYLAIAHRFWLGERMIADEWNRAQLGLSLSLPFYCLYQWVTGGNEGVYLYFRILYWGLSTFVAFFTYFKLKKWHSHIASLICALMYLFYSRANINGVSYYNLTLTCVLLSVLLLYEQICQKKGEKWKLFLIGILLALAVVITPFLAAPYILIGTYLIIRKKYRFLLLDILAVMIGTGTTALIYICYILYNLPINELFLNIPYILSDSELQSTPTALIIPLIFVRIAWRYKWTICGSVLLIIYSWYKKKKNQVISSKEVGWLTILNLLIFFINSFLSSNLLGCIYIAGTLFMIPVLILTQKQNSFERQILSVFGVAGISLVLAFSFSSNTGLDAMAIGFVIIGMSVVLLIFQTEELQKKKMVFNAVLMVSCIMLLQTGFLRLFSVYRDAPIRQLDTQITSGPAKYLYTTSEHVRQYEELKNAIEQYVREDDIIFYSKEFSWGYICSNNEYGTPASWRMEFNSPRLEKYYKLHPEKIPTCIFVLNPAYGAFESSLIQNNEKSEYPNTNNISGYLYDYIQDHHYEKIELECATIYRLPSP